MPKVEKLLDMARKRYFLSCPFYLWDMRRLPIFILLCCIGWVLPTEVFSQRVKEDYENGQKKYRGKLQNGLKVGKHSYWHETGEKKKEETYTENGLLIRIEEWNKEGDVIRDENPEEVFEKMRARQFEGFNWVKTEEGLAIQLLRGQKSPEVRGHKDLIIHYATYLPNGKELDNSIRRELPIAVNLYRNNLVKGFVLGLRYFTTGDNGYLKVPAHLAYGDKGTENIPADSPIIFHIIALQAR